MEELGKKIDEVSNHLTQLRIEIWTKYTLFTWVWWTLLIGCIIFAILFFILIDKKKYMQSVAYFGIVYILNRNLDDIATVADWYDYRMQLEPTIPTNIPANLFIIPVSLTIIYQRYDKWKGFIIASALYSATISYVILPLMEVLKIYKLKVWNSTLSFISLIAIGALSKLLVDKIKLIQEKAR